MGVADACKPIDGPANVYFFVDYMLMFVKCGHGRGRPPILNTPIGLVAFGKVCVRSQYVRLLGCHLL